MAKPIKDAWSDSQLSLFEGFFTNLPEQSRTLDIYDALPKFSFSHAREVGDGKNLREFNDVHVHGQVIKVSVSAATLGTDSKPGDKDVGEIKGRVVFPGAREELVERALRKMAIQRQIQARLEFGENGEKMIPIEFTLSELRSELQAAGHSLNISQLREALDVLGGATIKIEGIVGDDSCGFPHPLLLIVYKRGRSDQTGERSYYSAKFHPFAVRAILAGAWQPINYTRVMELELPLARWIVTRMNNRFKNAARRSEVLESGRRGYFLTLNRVLAESGIRLEPRLRDTIKRVREAIEELKEAGFLDRLEKPYVEELIYEPTKGRSKVVDAKWTLFPSRKYTDELIDGNAHVRRLKDAVPELIERDEESPKVFGNKKRPKAGKEKGAF